ncbi:hypothetical protein BC835DRAFT_1411023 [Cytidiella melzeri]|nr:hypothetical protein BC835DRAFT_1411023 [Cytidiella melzeri]
MTTTTEVEQQRQRYATELAEYTRRQWDMARQSLDRVRSNDKPQSNGHSSPPKDNSRAPQGIQSHDYAHHPHRRGANVAHEGRVVAANW